jgi:hypothetical protein
MPHDGRLELVLGDPGAGKDSFIYWQIQNRPFVLVQTAPNNGTMDNMAYVYDSDKNIERAYKMVDATYRPEGYIFDDHAYYHFAVFFRKNQYEANPKLWPFMEYCPTLWLGDVNYWCADWHRGKRFELFIRDIRGRDQLVYGSTHRSKADLPPVVFQYARKIYWVGPFTDDKPQLMTLYGKKSAGLFGSVEEFEDKIRNLEKFDYANPNPDRSVLTIKDETS